MASSGIYQNEYADNDSLLDSEFETETLPDLDRDDADLESISPSDGYFTDRRHPQHTFVQSSSVQAQADGKAREASLDSSAPTPPQRTAPILDAGLAPPDYAAATAYPYLPTVSQTYGTSLPSAGREPQPQNNLYWPFGNRFPFSGLNGDRELHSHAGPPSGARAEAAGTGAGAGAGAAAARAFPQIMSDSRPPPPLAPDEETGLLRERKPGKISGYVGFCIKMVVVTFVIVAIAVGSQVLSDSSESDIPGDDGTGATDPSNPFIPTPLPDTSRPYMPIASPSRTCPYSSYSSAAAFDFPSPASFSFLELLGQNERFSGRIAGTISIKPADPSQDVNVRVWVQYTITAPWQVTEVRYVLTDTSLELKLPEMRPTIRGRPCLHIGVIIQVKQDTIVENWDIATQNLAVEMDEALFLQKSSHSGFRITTTSITTKSGHVKGYWSSRKTKIDTSSGAIKGTFALEDLLSIHSSSGSIDVSVDPKEADPEHSAPAEYVAVTSSGSITTRVRTSPKLPLREYQTRVETRSASISGNYVHGSTTSFSSTSGSIRVDVVPIVSPLLEPTPPSMTALRTDTTSGQTVLHLLSPSLVDVGAAFSVARDGKQYPAYGTEGQARRSGLTPGRGLGRGGRDDKGEIDEGTDNLKASQNSNPSISCLRSTHKSVSGSITLTYPGEWTGEIEGESISGRISVKGKDVQFLPDETQKTQRVGHHVVARKGQGGSHLGVATTSGSVGILVGRQ